MGGWPFYSYSGIVVTCWHLKGAGRREPWSRPSHICVCAGEGRTIEDCAGMLMKQEDDESETERDDYVNVR
jgi:hypothetical protein